MRILTTSFFALAVFVCSAQNAVESTEQQLTDGSSKTWVYYQTVETMGVRASTYSQCVGEQLTYTLSTKTHTGAVCKSGDSGGVWSISGHEEDEQYITMGNKEYMIDIYQKNIDGVRKQVLRLKLLSTSKEEPSVGYIYTAVSN